jgi:hypothetical protein
MRQQSNRGRDHRNDTPGASHIPQTAEPAPPPTRPAPSHCRCVPIPCRGLLCQPGRCRQPQLAAGLQVGASCRGHALGCVADVAADSHWLPCWRRDCPGNHVAPPPATPTAAVATGAGFATHASAARLHRFQPLHSPSVRQGAPPRLTPPSQPITCPATTNAQSNTPPTHTHMHTQTHTHTPHQAGLWPGHRAGHARSPSIHR